MAHILCMTSGLTGILYASLELSNRLQAMGHTVTYASPKSVEDKVVANSITYRQLPPTNFFPAPKLPSFNGPLQKFQRLWYRIVNGNQLRARGTQLLGMDEFREILDEISPDLIILDVELHDHIMTLVAENKIPFLLLSQWFSLWNRPGLPPITTSIIPGNGFLGSFLGIRLAWLKIKWERSWKFGKLKWRTFGTDRRSILKAYARKVGFPLQYAKENYWPGPFTYNSLPVISMTLEALEFPHKKQEELQYVGPMIFANRKNIESRPEVVQRLAQIFERKEKESKALLYCSVSSFKKGDTGFLRKIVAAVSKHPEWLLIISLGGLVRDDFLSETPDNVYPFSWVPQLQVLEKADCSINHGGIHTINECLHFKVPMLVYSGKRSDQDGCAARIAYHQIGLMADKDQDDIAAISSNIAKALHSPIIKQKLEAIHENYLSGITQGKLESIINQKLAKA